MFKTIENSGISSHEELISYTELWKLSASRHYAEHSGLSSLFVTVVACVTIP